MKIQYNEKNGGQMIDGINHITISVKNIDTAFSFYKDILKLKPVMKSSRSAYFYAGKTWIALDKREPYNASENYSHICFNVSKRHFKKFVEGIRGNKINEWQKNETEGDSLYILDDSGNKLEIHFSTLRERIKYGKKHYDKGTQWFL
jgi:catechol 2,3-dioxygenase-like lactoylglutathione lyase family enzyme